MKAVNHTLLLLLVLCFLQSRAQNPQWEKNRMWEGKLKAPHVEIPADKFRFNQGSVSRVKNPGADYNRYRKQQLIGFTMVPIGAGAMAGGSYMIYKGALHLQKKVPENTFLEKAEKNKGVVLASAGAALAFLGLAVTSGGLVLGVTGTVRKNKFRESTHGVYIKTTTKAVSLVYKF
jgi:hypothetical protein